MTKAQDLLAEGDRVDHAKFGLGTVSAVETFIQGNSTAADHGQTVQKVTVACDDPQRGKIRVLGSFLRKIASPDTRPFVYWDRQWRPLHADWLAARRAVEQALAGLRPAPDRDKLEGLRAAEAATLEALERFLADEQAGLHD